MPSLLLVIFLCYLYLINELRRGSERGHVISIPMFVRSSLNFFWLCLKISLRLFHILKINLLCQSTTLTLFTEWTGLLRKNPPLQFCFPMFTFLLTTRQTLSHVVGYFVVVILHMDTLSTQTTHMHFPSTRSSILSVKLYSIQKSQVIHMQHLNNCNYINVFYTWVMQYTVIIFLCLHILFFLELTKYLSFADGNSF